MICGIRLPIPWPDLGFPAAVRFGPVTVSTGSRAWSWDPVVPDLDVRDAGTPPQADSVEGWGIDHVVLLVPDLDAAGAAIRAVAGESRRRETIRGRDTAFWLVGTLLEVVEEASVDRPLLYGLSLTVDRQLVEIAEAWRSRGLDVSDPRPAFQTGRRILTVRGLDAGLAVMDERPNSG